MKKESKTGILFITGTILLIVMISAYIGINKFKTSSLSANIDTNVFTDINNTISKKEIKIENNQTETVIYFIDTLYNITEIFINFINTNKSHLEESRIINETILLNTYDFALKKEAYNEIKSQASLQELKEQLNVIYTFNQKISGITLYTAWKLNKNESSKPKTYQDFKKLYPTFESFKRVKYEKTAVGFDSGLPGLNQLIDAVLSVDKEGLIKVFKDLEVNNANY